MKTGPLTDEDIKDLKWHHECLRRNPEYRERFKKLFPKDGTDPEDINDVEFQLDVDKFCEDFSINRLSHPDLGSDELCKSQQEVDKFCEDFKIGWPCHPDVSFDELCKPKQGENEREAIKRIQSLYINYTAGSDDAAFTRLGDSLVQGRFLRIYVNLERGRNQIERQVKRILDEWITDHRRKFHGIKKNPNSKRLHSKTWQNCFQIYDMVTVDRWPIPDVALKMGLKVDTVHKRFKRAWMAIHQADHYPSKRKRRSIDAELPCDGCPHRKTNIITQKQACLVCSNMKAFLNDI